ncbi:MAG: acetyl-CoA carboxylase biotin carboxyl carrier protein subunit [Bacteroidales bacterium]|nr:acetyl-CoA carboxylase biotin carboxyl carrier protein subunit [Bacteroidales bacterium]MBR6990992.1 acetyl-CoA carboxylase biotin carboxyl carrier protein subunit [Bacteroidales bacterium]
MKNFKFKINGTDYNVDINEVEGQEIKLDVNGTPYVVTVDKEMRAQKPRTTIVSSSPAPRVAAAAGDVQRASAPNPNSAAGGTKVATPLPGTILDVFVNVGDQVKAGQRVVLLEAMKMENNIEADTDGTVTSVNVRKGDSVLEGDTLIVIS